jgi:hypothetical protein
MNENRMNEKAEARESYCSFEEFQQKFYPIWCRSQDNSLTKGSFGGDLARYSLDRHFPLPQDLMATEPS